MNEYRVIITETLKRAVTVEAESREEAEEAVRRQYQNSEHILVAEDFDGVSFSAQYPEQQVELPYGKMKELFRKAERAALMYAAISPLCRTVLPYNTANAPAPTPCPAAIKRFSRTWVDIPSMEAVWTERIPVSGWSSIWRSNAVVKRAGA